MRSITFFFIFVFGCSAIQGQDAINIFIDCNAGNCDMNYIKNNLTFVNYMRNVQDADLYIQVLSQKTGSGGEQVTLSFEGQKDWDNQKSKITYHNESINTDAEKREQMAKNLKAGLLPYVAQTTAFKDVKITYEASEKKETTEEKDPWNYWLYSVGLGGYTNGQSISKNLKGWGNVSAVRTTEDWKFAIQIYGNADINQYEIEKDGEKRIDTYRKYSYGTYNYAIKSLAKHWALGSSIGFRSSSFSNLEENYYYAPIAPEYNIFPYSEATQRVLRVSYRPALEYKIYEDTTIYNKKQEFVPQHSLRMTYETQAKFGSIYTVISARQYLHKPDFYRLMFRTNLSIRIAKGLNLELSGQFNWIRDQIALRKGSASEQDILTQQRELATNYSYWSRIGISYSFGSIYNNVVFPRFGGSM